MSESVKLTPSQSRFLKKHVPDYQKGAWLSEQAGQAGSERRFIRVKEKAGTSSYILVVWDSGDRDWERFLGIFCEHSKSLSVFPEIYASDEKHGLILEEDLGSVTLKQFVSDAPSRKAIKAVYSRVIDSLLSWHYLDIKDGSVISSRSMDEEMFLWESEYFATHCVTDFFGKENLLSPEWEEERKKIASASALLPKVCIHRDFQSENIMLSGDSVKFIDFQGARLGPAEYDLASLLFDPYVPVLDMTSVYELTQYYSSKSRYGISQESFYTAAVQRLMQALGAFCNLSIHKEKEWYGQYIPVALERLSWVLSQMPDFSCTNTLVMECVNSL